MDDKFWYLKSCDLFERLDKEQVSRLESRSTSRIFQRNSLVYVPTDENDSVLLLVSGRVKIYHVTGDGKQALLTIIDPGELFGELAVFSEGRRDEFAETMEASTIVHIPGNEVQRLMSEHPTVSLEMTRLMGLRRKGYERRLKSLLFRSNREKLVHLLLELVEKYGQQTPDGVLIGLKLSHQDLASIIGSTRETVTVVLGELEVEGRLIKNGRRFVLTNVDRLAESIEVDPPQVVTTKKVVKERPKRTRLPT